MNHALNLEHMEEYLNRDVCDACAEPRPSRAERALIMYTPDLAISYLEDKVLVPEFLKWCGDNYSVAMWGEYRMMFALGRNLDDLLYFALDDIEAFADYLDLEED